MLTVRERNKKEQQPSFLSASVFLPSYLEEELLTPNSLSSAVTPGCSCTHTVVGVGVGCKLGLLALPGLSDAAKHPLLQKLLKILDEKCCKRSPSKATRVPSSSSWAVRPAARSSCPQAAEPMLHSEPTLREELCHTQPSKHLCAARSSAFLHS